MPAPATHVQSKDMRGGMITAAKLLLGAIQSTAGHRYICLAEPALSAVHKGAGARTLPLVKFNLKGTREWQSWCKHGERPVNVPACPDRVYTHEGWQGYGHWLGTGTVAPKEQKFLAFKKALLHARSPKLKSVNEWQAWSKTGARPANISSFPSTTYKHGSGKGGGTGWAPAQLLTMT